jgi:proteasome accessory factor B
MRAMKLDRKELARMMADVSDRRGSTRRPLLRIYEIHAAITSGTYPNCSQLAAKLSVQPKTVQRDITFMRDELNLPVKYEEIQHGFYYEEDVSSFPVFQTSAEDLAALFLARTALESVRGTQLAEIMQKVFSKLTRGIEGKVQFSWSALDDAFSRKTLTQRPRDVQLFGLIAESIMNQLVTTFYYKKLEASKPELRQVYPLHLGEVDSGWYLIAHDLKRGELRTFALPRITRFKATAKKFERPRGFDGRDHLKQSFGIWNVAGDDTRQVVRVELKDYAARLAQERRWHPSQEVFLLNTKGNRVEVRFEVGRLEEVLRWVLSFGSQAKVLGPRKLVEMLKKEIEAMRKN